MGTDLAPRRQRLEDVGALLAKVGGTATPGELGAALDLNRARQADVLTDLAAADLVVRGRGRVQLTPEGWARFAGIGPGSAGEVLDRVLTCWPARHRAFLELLVCSVIARHHLAEAYPKHPHLGFMAIGETGTGKSAMAELVCHLFGFDPVQASVFTPAEITGSLLGRRDRAGEGWTWEPAPMTHLSFVLLDEFDKADGPVQRVAWNYFRGAVAVQAEGQRHQLRPTPMLGANPPAKGDRLGPLRQEYRRRSAVLDTGGTSSRDLEQQLSAFYASTGPADRLSLPALVPPAALDHSALLVLQQLPALKDEDAVLTRAGLDEFPGVRALELATLGRLALLGPAASHGLAAAATLADYLTITESVPGQVHDGWQPRLADSVVAIAGGEPLLAALERSARAKAEHRGQVTANRRRTQHAAADVRYDGAVLAERCRLAHEDLDARKVPREHKPAAAALRKALARHQDSASKVSTAGGLAEITAMSAPVLEDAGKLAATLKAGRDLVDAARRESVDERQRDRAEAKRGAAWQAQQRKAHKRKQDAELKQLRADVKPLETLWRRRETKPGESPLAKLLGLQFRGTSLLTYEEQAPQAPANGWARVAQALSPAPQGWYVVAGTRRRFSGAQLGAWGVNTQAVLAPTIVGIHRLEHALELELGRVPRQRPPVPSPQLAIGARR